MQSIAAVAALLPRHSLKAQPLSTRRACRIQTLHRPAGQILHSIFTVTSQDMAPRVTHFPSREKIREVGRIVREADLCVKKNHYNQ
jgi:hypothetical protein